MTGATDPPRGPSTHRMLTVVGLVASLGMGALEATVVSTAMPSVVGDLGGIELYAWVTTAYLLASTVVVPIVGKLADIYGRKPLILIGIALFLAGSTASGLCQSMTQLILFRALQGLGAGIMQPMALTIVGDIFDLEERARMQGVFGAVWGVSGLVGPLLGGFIVKYLSWRWVFYINLPFGLIAAALISTQLWESVDKRHRKLDVLGAITCSGRGRRLLLLAAEGRLPRIAASRSPRSRSSPRSSGSSGGADEPMLRSRSFAGRSWRSRASPARSSAAP